MTTYQKRLAAALHVLAKRAATGRLDTVTLDQVPVVQVMFLDDPANRAAAARVLAALTGTSAEEWAGDMPGWRFRTTTGLLLTMRVEVTELLPLAADEVRA